MDAALKVIRSFGPVRAAIIATGLIAAIGLFGWLLSRVATPDQALLYADLDIADSARIVDYLDGAGVAYELRQGGTAIYVAAPSVPRTRVALAEKGLPAGGSTGYELFDTAPTLGTTNFMQNVNLVRALEGELARSIRSIEAVQSVRVHLVLPKREMFSRDRQQASASVLLRMRGNARLGASQVVAIQNLVASAVADLDPAHISIVDGRGTLLTRPNSEAGSLAALTSDNDERRRQFESHLRGTLEQLLGRTLGAGKVRAEVNVEMDFDRINTSEELFDPDGQVVRSTQSVEESGKTRDATTDPTVSVATNLPDPSGGAGSGRDSSTAEDRSEETVNYEISKKVINHVREAGIVKKLSVAVLVDGVSAGEGSAASYRPRTPEELDQIGALVRGAIGFDARRGDRVEVINMEFVPVDLPLDAPATLFGIGHDDLFRMAQSLFVLVFGILVLLLIVRPVVNRALEAARTPAGGGVAQVNAAAAPALAAPMDTSAEMIDVERVEGQVKASLLNTVSDIVEKHPDESLAIVRGWLHAES